MVEAAGASRPDGLRTGERRRAAHERRARSRWIVTRSLIVGKPIGIVRHDDDRRALRIPAVAPVSTIAIARDARASPRASASPSRCSSRPRRFRPVPVLDEAKMGALLEFLRRRSWRSASARSGVRARVRPDVDLQRGFWPLTRLRVSLQRGQRDLPAARHDRVVAAPARRRIVAVLADVQLAAARDRTDTVICSAIGPIGSPSGGIHQAVGDEKLLAGSHVHDRAVKHAAERAEQVVAERRRRPTRRRTRRTARAW